MKRAAAGLALAYGIYFLYRFATGGLYFYIHPIYVVPTAVTGALLVALGVVSWRAGGPGVSRLAAAALAVPVALGFMLPAQPLSPATASQRGVASTSLGRGDVPTFDVEARPERYTIKDWVKVFAADPEPGRHAGKPVRVTGFVHHDSTLPDRWFLVARFVVQCCAVDAQPVGLPVRSPGPTPEGGRWVTVEGTWEVHDVDGRRRAVIAATAVAATARPEQPYLY
jgi:putative membrane protein